MRLCIFPSAPLDHVCIVLDCEEQVFQQQKVSFNNDLWPSIHGTCQNQEMKGFFQGNLSHSFSVVRSLVL